ncbi:MAG: cob(I)yrinic acid a,c-diamide adenosyltransferase [Salinivirgaceae bacterium]
MYHVITGNGKGKTTAALGMSMRAAGAGMNVFFAQFVKGKHYAEHAIMESIPQIDFALYGRTCFIEKEPEPADYQAAQNGWQKVCDAIHQKKYQLVVLDELHIALYYGLITINEVVKIISEHKHTLEIVSTGRYAPAQLVEVADLVSDITEVKHYYNCGVEARKGIEF